MEVVILEQMVPENHLLRKLDRGIDFSFINKLCAPLYSEILGGRWVPQACAQGRALWEIPFRIPERQKRLSLSTKIRADIHQSFRLPRILEQQQRLQKLSLQKAMHFLPPWQEGWWRAMFGRTKSKELHGLRYARMLGLHNMLEQSFLTQLPCTT